MRIGFDDSHSLGANETGGRVALPVFQDVMLGMYRDQLAGPAPSFPPQMEQRITRYLQSEAPPLLGDVTPSVAVTDAQQAPASPAEAAWFLHPATVIAPVRATTSPPPPRDRIKLN